MVPCSRPAFAEGAKSSSHQGNSSSNTLFCLDPGSNRAPECPRVQACVVSPLVTNRRAVYSTPLPILAWISNALIFWGSSKRCRGEKLGPWLSILQRAAAAGAEPSFGGWSEPRPLPCTLHPCAWREEWDQLLLLLHAEGCGCKGLTAVIFSLAQAHTEAN